MRNQSDINGVKHKSWRAPVTRASSPVEAFGWRCLAAVVVYSERRGADVRVQAFGVADVFEDPGS